MNTSRFIILVLLILALASFGGAYVLAESSKNSKQPHPVSSKDLTLFGDARVMCWYGVNEKLGEGIYCFVQPHDNMQFLENVMEEPPAKKVPVNSSPSSPSPPTPVSYTTF